MASRPDLLRVLAERAAKEVFGDAIQAHYAASGRIEHAERILSAAGVGEIVAALEGAEKTLQALSAQPRANDPWQSCAGCGSSLGYAGDHFSGCYLKTSLDAARAALKRAGPTP